MFNCTLELQRTSPSVSWPHEVEATQALYTSFAEYRASFPDFLGVDISSTDTTFTRVEKWESIEAASGFYDAKETQDLVAGLGFHEYVASSGLVKNVKFEGEGIPSL